MSAETRRGDLGAALAVSRGMWTRIVGWAGLMALAGTLAAHAQAVVPQYTHRGFVGAVAFDADDARVAVASSGGFVSVIDVASGRVLAVRRLLRSNEAGFIEPQLDGPIFRALATIAGDELAETEWNWVEDAGVETAQDDAGGWLAARGPHGRVARIDPERNLKVGRRSVTLEGPVSRLAWPHRRVLALERPATVELRSARDPSHVIATLPGRALAVARDGRRVATVDGEQVHIASLPRGTVRTVEHGLENGYGVVLGRAGFAVVGRQRSELHREGEAPTSVTGRVAWIGARSALIERDGGLVRLRLRDGSERQMVRDGVDRVWVGERGVVIFGDEEHGRFTLVRRDGSRRHYAAGGEHSVWHVHAAPGGESVVLGGRFGVQRWTAEGVVDGQCDGEGLLAVDWERGLSYGNYARCTRRGARRAYPDQARAMAATADGQLLFLSTGRFFGRRSPRARVRGLPESYCEDASFCNWSARFEAKGELLVVEMNRDYGGEEDENRVIRTRTGRDLFRVPAGRDILVSADGSRIAVLHPGGGTVRDLEGRELFAFGSAEPDDDASYPIAAFSPDGARFAWSDSPSSLAVLNATGAPERTIDTGERPHFLALTRDAVAYGTAAGTVIRTGALTHREAAGVGLTGAACVEGHFRSLRADLQVERGPACREGRAERVGDLYFRKMGGAVRLWHGDRVMTLRTIRRGERATPMAYTPDGRWWTPGAGGDEAPEAPFAIRRGLESEPAAGAADPALLERLFGGRDRPPT